MDRRSLLAGLALTGLASQAWSASGNEAVTSSDEWRLIDQFAESLSAHDIDAFSALFSETYINHQMSAAAPLPTGMPHKQITVGIFSARLKGLPDLKVSVEAKVVTRDMIAASFVYEGTHTQTYLSVPATGKRLRFTSCDIFRVADGKFAEHWGMGDIAGVMAQLRS